MEVLRELGYLPGLKGRRQGVGIGGEGEESEV